MQSGPGREIDPSPPMKTAEIVALPAARPLARPELPPAPMRAAGRHESEDDAGEDQESVALPKAHRATINYVAIMVDQLVMPDRDPARPKGLWPAITWAAPAGLGPWHAPLLTAALHFPRCHS